MIRRPPRFTLPYTRCPDTTLFRSWPRACARPARSWASPSTATATGCCSSTATAIRDGDDLLFVLATDWKASGRLHGPLVGTLMTNYGLESRSEEHTSELQSLMRNPYAVSCLQKKKQQTQ